MVLRALISLTLVGCAPSRSADPGGALKLDPPVTRLESGGLRLEEQAWSLGDSHGTAWRVSVPLPGHASVSATPSVVAFSELLPADTGPWAAINGGFYDTDKAAMGLVVSGGTERAPLRPSGGSGVFFWAPTGPHVVHRDAWAPGPPEAVQSIDRLVDQGKSVVGHLDGPLAARSAVAVGRARLWIVALSAAEGIHPVDGGVQLDHTVAHGLSLGRFAEYLLQSTDTVEALNLDGAVSTQLSVRTPEGAFALRGERGTINAVVLRP